MVTRLVPERLSWAMHTMAIAATDHVLEIGCGRGVAAALVCQRLTRGRLIALDRSATMAKLAEQRNIDSVESGRAVFLASPLDAADLRGERFDKIFAINVNLFWVRSSLRELDVIRQVMRRDGAMYLFYERPQAARVNAVAERMAGFLAEAGLATSTHTTVTRQGRTVACVEVRPPT